MHFSLASNEEMASQDLHLILHLYDTDTENTSLLVTNSYISLLFPSDTFMLITFAGALWQALLRVFEAEFFSCADSSLLLLDTKHSRALLLTAAAARSGVVSTRCWCCSSLIDGCLKYKHKEKPKTGPRPGTHLYYDVKIHFPYGAPGSLCVFVLLCPIFFFISQFYLKEWSSLWFSCYILGSES